MSDAGAYSLENARKFDWASLRGNLSPERQHYLERYLVGGKVLDAGCGGGAYVDFLVRLGFDVTGVDRFTFFLNNALQRQLLGHYVCGDLLRLPFPDNTFASTYCFDVLEHIDDQGALKELARVTRKRLILAVPKQDDIMHDFNLTFLHYRDTTHVRYYTERTLKDLISKISPASFQIFPELPVPVRNMFRALLRPGLDESIEGGYREDTMKRKIRRIGIRLIRSVPVFEKSSTALLHQLIGVHSFKTVYTGLVGIVDLNKKVSD